MAYDVLIVGGGIMGSSTAYHLAHLDHKLNVAVVERDPTYASPRPPCRPPTCAPLPSA